MSGSGDKDSLNKEIIDNLTKNLSENCEMTRENPQDKDNIPDFDIDNDPTDSDEDKPQQKTLENNDSDSEEDDEEALKKQEEELTEDDKERLKHQSSELKNVGNEEFKNQQYLQSIDTYTKALRTCPLKYSTNRAILYANRAASKIQVDRKLSAIDDCTKAIKLDDRYVRAYLRRAKLYEESDKLDESLEDFKKVAELDPSNREALVAVNQRLPPLIADRNEKLKTEMLGKLKDLGNLFLRPFGLSTDNFKLQQDPTSGGYSVNFQQQQPQSE